MTGVAANLAPQQVDLENPWPGLASFEEAASDFFHGREAEEDELARRVIASPVTVLFGKSGLGKTSLLKAGLFPRLRGRHFLPIYLRLAVSRTASALIDQVGDALRATFASEGIEASPMKDGESVWAYLHRATLELWDTQNYQQTPVFVFDQFEELFTLGESVSAAVQSFRVEFGDLAENRIPRSLANSLDADEGAAGRLNLRAMPYKVVVSLREDFLPDLEGWRRAIPSLGRVRFRLLPMRRDQAMAAVYGTAPHLLDEALAARIVRFVAAEQWTAGGQDSAASTLEGGEGISTGGIEPALLSLFCRGLNERRKQQKKARFDDDLLDSAQQGIISDYYRSCIDGMPDTVSQFIESELITEKGFRNSYAREDAVPGHVTQEQLDRLIGRRLLRLEERHGAQRVELTHDLLTRTVREHRDARRAEQERETLARQAEEQRRAIEEAGRRREAELQEGQRVERLQRLEAEARAGRRFKRLALALGAALLLAVGMAGYALDQRRLAKRESMLARDQAGEALRQGARAEQALERITNGIRMKQAVLSGDRTRIGAFLDSDLANHSIRFMARREDLGYKDGRDREIFKFLLSPDGSTLPTGDAAIAVVTYRMDHPTFQNSLLTTGRDRDFTASYTGWGCLRNVIVLIEYIDPERSPEIAAYDMCAALGG
jgi:conflict system STAND superfamily ATPase